MKKTISLFLVLSLLLLSIPLTAKEKKGADLMVRKTDGTEVRGELIAVKENSVVLMDGNSGADVTVGVDDISLIKIVKKSKALQDAGLLFLVFCGTGLVLGSLASKEKSGFDILSDSEVFIGLGFLLGLITGGIGAVAGSLAGKDETIQIKRGSDPRLKSLILQDLRKKARIKNFQ
jgi:hypothetical protein